MGQTFRMKNKSTGQTLTLKKNNDFVPASKVNGYKYALSTKIKGKGYA